MKIHGKITNRDGATITVVLACNDPSMRMPEPGMEIHGHAQRPQVTLPRDVVAALVTGKADAEHLAVAKSALAVPPAERVSPMELATMGHSFLPDVPDPDAALTPPDPAEAAPPQAPPKPKRTRDRA